jgi:hypothetical protein
MGEPNGNNKTVFLVTESHGQRTKHTLITAPDPFAFVALDGSAVLVLASPPDRAQPWVAFSVTSGAKIGQVEFTPGVRELSLVGSRVYWLSAASKGTREELTLHAAELASGANLWRLDAGSVESSIRQTRRQ